MSDEEDWRHPLPPPAPIEVVFKNRHFVVADKPPRMLSVPSRWGSEDPRPVLGIELEKIVGQRLWPVHRLDLDVSGLVLFAKSAEAHKAASAWFQNKVIQKTYQAWVEGDSTSWRKPDWVQWTSRILRGKKRVYENENGETAITRARFERASTYRSFPIEVWQLEPVTGKPHQLRYEIAKHKLPMIGDQLYGSTRELFPGVIALRSLALDLSTCPDYKRYELPSFLGVEDLERYLSKFSDSKGP